MSREAVDRVVDNARRAFREGRVRPRSFQFAEDGRRECCLLGAAAEAVGGDRSRDWPTGFGESQGLTTQEARGLMSGWDGCRWSKYDEGWKDRDAFLAGRALRRELDPGYIPDQRDDD